MKTIKSLYALSTTSYFKIEKWSVVRSPNKKPFIDSASASDNRDYLIDAGMNKDVFKFDSINFHTDILEYQPITNDDKEFNFNFPYTLSH